MGREGGGNPFTVASTDAVVKLTYMAAVGVVKTYLTRKQEGVVRRPILTL